MSLNLKNSISNNIENVIIIEKTRDETTSQKPKFVRLNLSHNLSSVRKELEKKSYIKNTLLFSKKYSENNNKNEFAEIALEDEDITLLDYIIDKGENKGDKILYLKKSSNPDWKVLNNLRRLDYGRTITSNGIKIADKRAFKMKNCKMTEIGGEGCQKGEVETKSIKERIMRKNLFFSSDIKVQNLMELGISVEKLKDENSNFEGGSSYHFTEYGKISINFSNLKPTPEFNEAVNNAKNAEDFKQITKEFGQFIPTEVILGGRAYFDDFEISIRHSLDNSNKNAMNANAGGMKVSVASDFNYSKGDSAYYKFHCTKLIGGKQCNIENFDENAWFESLEHYETWDCIEFRGPISIFQILPKDVRNKIFVSIGKRIHYATTEDFNYYLEEIGRPKIFELKIPSNFLNVIQDKAAECNIFATIFDTEDKKNGFFTCQVFYPPNGKPRLIIHCVQKEFKKRYCKLKISWMIVGFYTNFNFMLSDYNTQLNNNDVDILNIPNPKINTNFLDFKHDLLIRDISCFGIPVLTELDSSINSCVIGHHFFKEENKIGACTFSHCLKSNNCVKLPNFTFCILIISANITSVEYILENKSIFGKDTCVIPKFISLYFTKETYHGPIFLRQKIGQLKIESIDCKNNTCNICTNNKLTSSGNNIKCIFFDLNQVFILFPSFFFL